jgi:hypothetical protein
MEDAKPELKTRISNNISRVTSPYQDLTMYPEIKQFADALGSSYNYTFVFLYETMRDFRKKLFEAGGGAYRKTDGYELEQERDENANIPYGARYQVSREDDPKDTRNPRGPRNISSEKVKRSLPKSGEYAAIDSMIKTHSLDNTLHKFMFYLMTGRIDSPAVNVLALLGIDADSDDLQGLPDFETLTL